MATYKGIGYDSTNAKNRTGTSSDTIAFDTGMSVAGNLEVTGNIISRDEERVLVQDNFLDINFGYTTVAGLEGGLAANYLPTNTGRTINSTSANITFAAASGATRPTLSVAQAQLPAGTFSSGDLIQIAGTTRAENDGFYIVNSLTDADPAVLSIKSTAITSPDSISAKFAQINFTAETESSSTSVTITKVNVAALQVSTAGAWQVANGSVDSSFNSFTNLGISTLQQAYDAGNSITTDASGDILFTLSANSQGFSVQGGSSGTGGVSIGGDTAVNSYSFNASGGASTINSTGQNLTVSTTTSGSLSVTSAGTLAVTGASTSTFGDDTAVWSFDGSGAVSETGMTTFELTPSAGVTITGGSTCAIAATSGSALTLGDGVLTLSATSGALSESGLTSLDLSGTGTMNLTGGGVSTFGDDTAVWRFDGAGAVSETGMTTFSLTPSSSVAITGGSTCAIASTSGSAMTVSDGVLTLSATSGALTESGLTNLDLSGSGTVNIVGGGVSTFGDDTAVWRFDGAGALSETGMTTFSLTPSSTVDIDAAGGITIDGSSLLIGDDGDTAGISVLSTGGNLTLETGTSGNITITSVAAFSATSTTYDIDSSGAFTLDAATVTIGGDGDTGAINLMATSADIKLSAEGASNKAQIASTFPQLVRSFTSNDASLAAKDCVVFVNSGGSVRVSRSDADASSSAQFIGVSLDTAGAGAAADIVVSGIVTITCDDSFVAGNHIGKPVYLSVNAGNVSVSPPTGSGDVVYQVGICVDGSSNDWNILLQPQFIMEIG